MGGWKRINDDIYAHPFQWILWVFTVGLLFGSVGGFLKNDQEYKRGFMDAKSQGIIDMQKFVKENVVCQYVMNGTECDFKFVQCKANYRVAA